MPFNFNQKNVFLTYPQCSLSKEEVLEKLSLLSPISSYTISEEKHADGTPHVHCVITFNTRVHTTNIRYFDLDSYHPNIKPLRTKKDVQQSRAYVIKDGVFITNVEEVIGKRTMLAKELLEEGRITKKFILSHPEVIFLNHQSINQWLSYFKDAKIERRNLHKRRHYWVWGPSNCGKSYFLNAFLETTDAPAEIPTNNDFSHVSTDTDVLYIDEYKGNLTCQQLNRLCDGNTILNTKGGSTRISYPTVVVVSNYSIKECYPKVEDKIIDSLNNRFVEYFYPFSRPRMFTFIIDK